MANVCFIGKHQHYKRILENQQDSLVWLSLAKYFDNFFVIGESRGLNFGFDKIENVRLYTLPRSGPLFVLQAVFLGLILNLKYSVHWWDASEVLGGGFSVWILSVLTHVPFVQEIQGEIFNLPSFEPFLKRWVLERLGGFLVRKACRVRVISQAVRDQVVLRGVSKDKIFLVHLRVDLDKFDPARFDNQSLKRQMGFENKIIFGFLGRLALEKGLFDLFRAFRQICQKIPDSLLLIFGLGPLEADLRFKVRKLDLGQSIKFMGPVDYHKVPESLSLIDVFLHPSLHEGFGRSILEALAMGKAVVATKVGGIPDLIKDGKNGFLIEPHNFQALASKALELARNPELRLKFGKAGREWVKENYEWHDGIKKFADLFLMS